MNRLKQIFFFCIFISANYAFCQDLELLKNYTWEKNPHYHNEDSGEELIGLKDKVIVDFEYNNDGNLIEYYLLHNAYVLNSDEKIEDYNKLYLPSTSSSSQLMTIKARVINKDGEIVELDESKILTAKDESTKREYKYYAYEGVEKGSIIEYFYIIKRSPEYSGKRVTAQFDYVNNHFEFDLFSPSNLKFVFGSFNNMQEIVYDTNITDQNHWQMHVDKVDKLDFESQAAYDAKTKFFIYKLDRNTASNKYNLSSYSGIASNIYNLLYAEKTKLELKEINKIIIASECKRARNKKAKIRAIEDYIKSTFYVVEHNNSSLSNISEIIKNKTASHSGIVKLYATIYSELEIEHQIVLTCNRFNLKFDKKFESANFLTDYLIYFPGDINLFMSPISISSRLGFPPPEFSNNYGLFIKEININNMKTGIAKIKFIKALPYDKNYDNMIVDIELDTNDIDKSLVNFTRSTGGYYAINIQPFMSFYQGKDKEEIVEEYIKYLSPEISILNSTVYFDDAAYFGIEPFKVKSEFHLDPFIEKAGKDIIINVGALIGPQMEMYQEKIRVLPIENQFNRVYHRVITINIPEKYTIKNIDDLIISNDYIENSKTLMSFKSSYTLQDNVLIITIDEYYKIIEIESNLYEDYRRVINSAADFNKISLILE